MAQRPATRTTKTQDGKAEATSPNADAGGPPRTSSPRLSVEIGKSTPGYKLVKLIVEQAIEQNLTMTEVAGITGISSSTLSHLRRGRRFTTALERDIIDRLAEWMELPVIAVMILGEQVRMEDFYSPKEDMDEAVERAMRFIISDPDGGAMIPKAALDGDREMKLYTIWCYEQATQARLLSGGVDIDALLKEMKAFRDDAPSAL